MKLLLDECVTRHLKRDLHMVDGHEAVTVVEAGFGGLKNGQLLQAMNGAFDVLVTVDRNLMYQQNLKNFNLSILILVAKRNTYPLLKPLIPQALEALSKIKTGEVIEIKAAP